MMQAPRQHPVIALFVAMLGFAVVGCKGPEDLASLPPYPETYQRSWFGAMNDLAKGDLESARAGFLECEAVAPGDPSVAFQLGKIALEEGKPADAITHFNAALEGDPENLWIRDFRGQARLQIGDSKGGFSDAEAIVRSRPGDIERFFGWVDRLLTLRAVEEAIALCDTYESVSGPDVDVALQRLMLLEWMGDLEAYEKAIDAAMATHPDAPEFLFERAVLLESKGELVAAAEALEALLEEVPDDGLAALELARVLTSLANSVTDPTRASTFTDGALYWLQVAMLSEDVSVEEKVDILAKYLVIGSLSDEWNATTSDLIHRAISAHPDQIILYQLWADHAYGTGNMPDAMVALEQGLAVDPGAREVWRDAVALCAELGRYPRMYDLSAQALERFPLDAELYLLGVLAAEEVGEFEQGLEWVKRGAPLAGVNKPLKARFRSTEGSLLHAMGRDEAAAEAFEASLALVPDDAFVLNNHAYYLALSGLRLDRALECAQRANELMPGTPSFLDTEAWVLHVSGEHAAALERIEAAMAAGGANDAEVWEHEGDIRAALGDAEGARAAYLKAIELGGDAESLNLKINGL
jgi:tetratricopeptide (TPR) repeat protein